MVRSPLLLSMPDAMYFKETAETVFSCGVREPFIPDTSRVRWQIGSTIYGDDAPRIAGRRRAGGPSPRTARRLDSGALRIIFEKRRFGTRIF